MERKRMARGAKDVLVGAAGKLEWIAKLSKNTYPGGLPASIEEWRDLVNRIVLDVREVHAALVRQVESDKSDRSDQNYPARLIPVHGGYRNLKSFQVAEIVYDGTVVFCNRFVDVRSRTYDQMVQAARSGRQNIAEGSMASATSKKTELKLTGVAKASLEELLLDYEDFLRQRGLRQWEKDSPEALAVRRKYLGPGQSDMSDMSDLSDNPDPYGLATATPEVAANTLLCLINQACYLLKRQLENLEQAFIEEGGFTEKLYRVRSQRRAAGK